MSWRDKYPLTYYHYTKPKHGYSNRTLVHYLYQDIGQDLTGRERLTLFLVLRGKKLKNVARQLGVSTKRAGQIRNQALAKLVYQIDRIIGINLTYIERALILERETK